MKQAAQRSAQRCLVGPRWQHREAGRVAKVGPASPAVIDVVEFEAAVVEEFGECDVAASGIRQRSEFFDFLGPPARQ